MSGGSCSTGPASLTIVTEAMIMGLPPTARRAADPVSETMLLPSRLDRPQWAMQTLPNCAPLWR